MVPSPPTSDLIMASSPTSQVSLMSLQTFESTPLTFLNQHSLKEDGVEGVEDSERLEEVSSHKSVAHATISGWPSKIYAGTTIDRCLSTESRDDVSQPPHERHQSTTSITSARNNCPVCSLSLIKREISTQPDPTGTMADVIVYNSLSSAGSSLKLEGSVPRNTSFYSSFADDESSVRTFHEYSIRKDSPEDFQRVIAPSAAKEEQIRGCSLMLPIYCLYDGLIGSYCDRVLDKGKQIQHTKSASENKKEENDNLNSSINLQTVGSRERKAKTIFLYCSNCHAFVVHDSHVETENEQMLGNLASWLAKSSLQDSNCIKSAEGVNTMRLERPSYGRIMVVPDNAIVGRTSSINGEAGDKCQKSAKDWIRIPRTEQENNQLLQSQYPSNKGVQQEEGMNGSICGAIPEPEKPFLSQNIREVIDISEDLRQVGVSNGTEVLPHLYPKAAKIAASPSPVHKDLLKGRTNGADIEIIGSEGRVCTKDIKVDHYTTIEDDSDMNYIHTLVEQRYLIGDYHEKRRIATKAIGRLLMEGYILTQVQCDVCDMPLMEKSGVCACVVCPLVSKKAKKRACQKRGEQLATPIMNQTILEKRSGKSYHTMNPSKLEALKEVTVKDHLEKSMHTFEHGISQITADSSEKILADINKIYVANGSSPPQGHKHDTIRNKHLQEINVHSSDEKNNTSLTAGREKEFAHCEATGQSEINTAEQELTEDMSWISQEVYERLLNEWQLEDSNCSDCGGPLMQSPESKIECIFCDRAINNRQPSSEQRQIIEKENPLSRDTEIGLEDHRLQSSANAGNPDIPLLPRNSILADDKLSPSLVVRNNSAKNPYRHFSPRSDDQVKSNLSPSLENGDLPVESHGRQVSQLTVKSNSFKYLAIPKDLDLDDEHALLNFLKQSRLDSQRNQSLDGVSYDNHRSPQKNPRELSPREGLSPRKDRREHLQLPRTESKEVLTTGEEFFRREFSSSTETGGENDFFGNAQEDNLFVQRREVLEDRCTSGIDRRSREDTVLPVNRRNPEPTRSSGSEPFGHFNRSVSPERYIPVTLDPPNVTISDGNSMADSLSDLLLTFDESTCSGNSIPLCGTIQQPVLPIVQSQSRVHSIREGNQNRNGKNDCDEVRFKQAQSKNSDDPPYSYDMQHRCLLSNQHQNMIPTMQAVFQDRTEPSDFDEFRNTMPKVHQDLNNVDYSSSINDQIVMNRPLQYQQNQLDSCRMCGNFLEEMQADQVDMMCVNTNCALFAIPSKALGVVPADDATIDSSNSPFLEEDTYDMHMLQLDVQMEELSLSRSREIRSKSISNQPYIGGNPFDDTSPHTFKKQAPNPKIPSYTIQSDVRSFVGSEHSQSDRLVASSYMDESKERVEDITSSFSSTNCQPTYDEDMDLAMLMQRLASAGRAIKELEETVHDAEEPSGYLPPSHNQSRLPTPSS